VTQPERRYILASYGDIDAENGQHEDEEDRVVGRRTFGNYKPRNANTTSQSDQQNASSSDSNSNSNPEDEDEEDPTASLIREARNAATSKEQRKRKRAESTPDELKPPQPKQRKMNLNKVAAISQGGQNATTCHKCGERGHMKASCPQKEKRWKRKR
jgi:hypothetical protein